MKKLFAVLFLFLSTGNLFADQIPGFFEFETYYSRYNEVVHDYKKTLGQAFIKFRYGKEYKYFTPYLDFSITNNFKLDHGKPITNHPYYETYNFSIGTMFLNIFFVEFSHICGHQIISDYIYEENVYNEQTDKLTKRIYFDYKDNTSPINENKIKFGIKLRID